MEDLSGDVHYKENCDVVHELRKKKVDSRDKRKCVCNYFFVDGLY